MNLDIKARHMIHAALVAYAAALREASHAATNDDDASDLGNDATYAAALATAFEANEKKI